MALTGKFTLTTPLTGQTWTLSLPMTADRWVAFRAMLEQHVDFSDFYALLDALMKEAQRDYLGNSIEAAIPGEPENMQAGEGIVTWDELDYVVDYEVDFDGVVSTVETEQFEFLYSPGETHLIRVRGRSESGFGMWSELEFTYPPAAPVMNTPERYQLDVSFSWSAPTGADSYRVFGAFGSGVDENSTHEDQVETNYSRELSPGQTLYLRVAAINAGGMGPLSDEVSMQVPEA